MKHIEPLPNHKESSVKGYVAGFLFSLALTVCSFAVVWAFRAADGQLYSRGLILLLLAVFAIAQLIVQSLYFLHLSADSKVRPSLYSLLFAGVMIVVLVVGSIWIMNNLNYNMMPHNTTEYIEHKEGIEQR